MAQRLKQFVFPLFIIAVGVGWLLNALNILTPIDWLWSVSLAAAGLMILALGGIDRVTAVIGPWLIGAASVSVMRQTDYIESTMTVPLLIILFGALMFLSRLLVPRTPLQLERDRA